MRYIDSVCLFMFMEKCVIKSSDEPVDAGSDANTDLVESEHQDELELMNL